jgi:hypothetical protein
MYDTKGYQVDEELDEELQGPNNNSLTWHQRLFGALSDIADISAEKGGFLQSDLIQAVNFWSIDPPIDIENAPNGYVKLGVDQMKLFEVIRNHTPSEDQIDAVVQKAVKDFERQAEFAEMDQVDLMVAEMDQDLEITSNVVAYLMAVLNGESPLSHEIIDEMGCILVHVLTQWFFMYMVERKPLPPGDDIEAIKAKVSEFAMSTAQLAALPKEQKRANLESAIESFRHFGDGHNTPYDQDEDEEGDAPL